MDPSAGRFLTQDSFSGYSDLPQSQNPYVYGLSNPILYTDPSGKSSVSSASQAANGNNSAIQSAQGFGGGPCIQWDQLLMAGGAEAVAFMTSEATQFTAWAGSSYQQGLRNPVDARLDEFRQCDIQSS